MFPPVNFDSKRLSCSLAEDSWCRLSLGLRDFHLHGVDPNGSRSQAVDPALFLSLLQYLEKRIMKLKKRGDLLVSGQTLCRREPHGQVSVDAQPGS